jgi:hypothetical protein
MLFAEFIGQMVRVFVVEQSCRFLDAGTILQEFASQLPEFFQQPFLRAFAHFFEIENLSKTDFDGGQAFWKNRVSGICHTRIRKTSAAGVAYF